MKTKMLTVLALVLTVLGAQAAPVLLESFSYPAGSLVGAPGSPWATHSGTAGQVDVVAGRVNLTQAELEDVNAPLSGGPYSTGNLYACFTVNFSVLPTGAGTYFAHFKDATTGGFRCRVFATTNGAAVGRFRVAIANAVGATPTTIIPTDLSLGVDYVLVVRYTAGPAASIASTLWINPASEADVANRVAAADVTTVLPITGFGLRQSLAGTVPNQTGMGTLTMDNLRVGTTWNDIKPPPTPNAPPVRSSSNGLPPADGVYVSPALFHAAYANGIIISNISHRKFTQSTPPPPAGGTQVHSFGSQVQLDQSSGGPGAVVQRIDASANCSVRVSHAGSSGDTQIYDTEMLQLDIGGGLPGGVMIRESPTLASIGRTTVRPVDGGFEIGSFFDIFTEISLDAGASWSPALQAAHVELRVDPTTIPPITAPSNLLPPRNDLYISPGQWHVLFAQGIIIRDIRHSFFTQSLPPPPPGGSQTHQFGSQVDYQISTDGGQSFRPGRAPASTEVGLRHRATDGGVQTFDTEMLSLDLQGGDLPPGMRLRESPSKQSLGGTAITQNPDGTARIGSFFDIFTEISLDGGQNWAPAQAAARVTLVCETPEHPFPDPNLPPPAGQYVSPAQYHAAYAAGIIIRNVSHNRFTQSQPPPPLGGTQVHSFGSQVHFEISTDGGNTFSPASAPANVSARVTSSVDSGDTRFFDTEMLALDIQGGSLPAGVRLRESPSKASLGRTSMRMVNDPATGIWDYISSFFDIFTEVSLDGGATWSPALTPPVHMGLVPAAVQCAISISCPASITVTTPNPAGAVVNYPPPTVVGNCGPFNVTCNPPSGSPFPIGTSTVTCTASDAQGNAATCAFKITVRRPKPGFFPTPVLPPPNGVYISPSLYHQLYANGIYIRDIKHRRFTGGQPPPPVGGQPQEHQFGSVVELEHSTDGGVTFQKVSAPANCTVRVTPSAVINPASIGTQTFDTEMLQLDIGGGSLPVGVMLRESPTKASTGQTTVSQISNGYLIDSFFDIFTEISLDGGANWSPALEAAQVELRPDVALVAPIKAPTRLLPPPNDAYISPAQFHILAAQGIVIKDVRHSFFTPSMPPPPPGTMQIHQFDSQLDMMVSRNGGQTFQPVRAPAAVVVEVEAVGSAGSGLYDTEMLALNATIPMGTTTVMIRESPTEPSRGSVSIQAAPIGDPDFDLLRIGSFFDIFVEVSLDGGQNWAPAQSPAHVELICDAPEQPEPSPNLPPLDGQYISPQKFHALYAQGIIISNVTHRRFTQSTPPPLPGGTQVHTFNSDIDMEISQNGGQTWSHVQAPAAVQVRVTSLVDDGATRFFDTEMLSLNIQGGGLGGVMVRESPSKASLGRTSIRMVNDPATGIWDYISSFFDIFTEVSLDGGATWLPALTPPVHMVLLPVPCLPLISCPADTTASTFLATGKAVTFAPTVGPVDTCGAPVTSSCSPASGSNFPVGTTTVTCTASSVNGTVSCSFNVTVIRRVLTPRWFPTPLLPPPQGEYITPQRWHQMYANGIIISNVSHRRFTQSFPPPAPGTSATHSFGSEVTGQVSMDGGQTFIPLVGMGSADVTVRVTHIGTVGGTQTFDTEMLSLTLMTTNGLKLRESPSKASTGGTTMRSSPGGGFVIDSFFDVFTEISLDGGATWSPAQDALPVELHTDAQSVAPITAPTRLLPPPNDLYVSPQQYHLLLAQGIQIRNVRHKFFTQSLPPQPGATTTHTFGSQVDMELSQDGGATFRPMRAPADVAVSVQHRGTSPDGTQIYDTEMLQLDMVGGDLPAGVRLRESPTRASQGGTAMAATPDGQFRVHSFFDIFTEVSLDGGQNWIPTPDPARVELVCEAPPIPLPNPNLPPLDGQYISPQRWHALYAQGIIISNVTHKRFTQTFPPPPPGVTETHSFGSVVECDLSFNNGQAWQHTTLPAQVTVSLREMQSSGDTRFFETEMLALNISGGGLPTNVMVRESPSKASLGRTSIRMVNDPATGIWDYVSSFFDIFTELSTDGGQTWQPSLTAPGTVTLVPAPVVNCATIACPSNIVAWTCSSNGAVVNYAVAASNICGGTVSVTCVRPSGSTFPVGVSTVTCTATAFNSAGAVSGTVTCSFTVTVTQDVRPPTLVCPSSVTIRTCADREIVTYATPTATDDCDPAPAVSCVPPSGSVFPAGVTTVNCTARDACGNKTNCTFSVTIIAEPLPRMVITHLGNGLIRICWTTPCPSYRLQCARGLETPVLWENVTNAVSSVGGTNCVTLPLQPNRRFYRLIRNTPQEVFSAVNTLPPVGSFNSPSDELTVFPVSGVPGGVITRWFVHRIPPRLCPPLCPDPLPCLTCPPLDLQFATTIDFQYSTDGGRTFLNASASAGTSIRTRATASVGPVQSFDTEMLSLNISGGTLPTGVMVRESPTRASTGKHVVRAIDGGNRISSFFDVFLDVSLDNGQNWVPSPTPVHVDYNGLVPDVAAATESFPPIGIYVNPPTVPSHYGNGVIARGFRHRILPLPCPPFCPTLPPCLTCPPDLLDFPTTLDVEVSSDGGQTFQALSVPVQTRATVRHTADTSDTRFFDVEIFSLAPTPGSLPVRLRESPTLKSTGKTTVQRAASGNGFRISSFFDVFTEISLDGGQSWSSVVNPTHVELESSPTTP